MERINLPPPILIYRHVECSLKRNSISFCCKLSFGILRIGAHRENLYSNRKDHTVFIVDGTMLVKGRAHFYGGSRTVVRNGAFISIGKDFEIGCNSAIIASQKIEIGDNCMLSWEALIIDSDLHPIYKGHNRLNLAKEISIGNNVWIGCRCSILKGAIIPDGTIIGACSLMSGEIKQENTIVAGKKIINQNVTWSRVVSYD